MASPEQTLVALGFSAYEARVYIALLGSGTCNGYEVAKQSGVPRANVYDVLDRLVKRKAVTRRQADGRGRYLAVSPERLAEALGAEHDASIQRATKALAPLASGAGAQPILEIEDYEELVVATRGVLASAGERVAIALCPSEASVIGADAAEAVRRGTHVVSVCLASCQSPCGGCAGTVYRHNASDAASERRSLVVIGDGRRAIVGNIDFARTSAISTTQSAIVGLAQSFISATVANSTVFPET